MGQIVVNVGSFDLTSHNGNTAYSQTRYFDIPANAGITSCVATFATHVNTGSFQGKSFSLNGAQAHPNTPWPTSGISLNAALLATGQNTFRAAVKSQAGLSARWSIGDIYLTIDYIDVGGGGGTTDPGTISISKTSLTAGESLTVSITGASSGVYRDVYIFKMPSSAGIGTVVQGHGSGAGSWTVNIPVSWCETHSPDDPSFEIQFYMVSYVVGGAVVGDGARMLTVNVPATAVPTIGTFTATRDANGVDASITKYVQNYSKVNLAMGSVAGALGSSIQSYEITGAGFSAAAASASFGPFAQTGDITFTAKATDTRGRTATKTVTINVLAYTPVSAVSISAFRADSSGDPADEGTYAAMKGKRVFGSLDSQNTAVIKGRVFEKGTTPPDWTSMSDDTLLLIGSLSIEKGYTVQIAIADKITSVIYIIEIPTAIVGIHITPGATGGGFGMYGQPNRWDFHKPVFANDTILTSSPNPNLLHNWDFRNPINQRGVSGAISTGTYFYDRWIMVSGTVTTNAAYLTIGATGEIEQRIEGNLLAGKTVTAGVMVGGTVYSGTGTMPTSAGTVSVTLTGWGTATLGYVTGYMYLRLSATAESNVQAVKLEIGTVSTLHLDPPMDHAVELPKCQRYCFVFNGDGVGATRRIGTGVTARPTGKLEPHLFVPQSMRITPTVTIIGTWRSHSMPAGVDGPNLTAMTVSLNTQNSLILVCTFATSLTSGNQYVIYNPGATSKLIFSADL